MLNFLATLPLWVLFVWLAAIYIVGHLMGLPREQVEPLGRRRALGMRVASTLLLILALFTVNRANVMQVLLPTALACISGYLNGRSVDMKRLREQERLRRERRAARTGEESAADGEVTTEAKDNPVK